MVKTSVIALLLTLFLAGCGPEGPQWKEVHSFEKLQAGNAMKIVPVKDSLLELPGAKFSVTSLQFKCTALRPLSGAKYKGTTTIESKREGLSMSQTLSMKDFQTWPVNAAEQVVEIPIIIEPSIHSYEGKGEVYMYLVDSTETCVSNIIAWKITFK